MARREERGFTLIEVTAVLILLALLAMFVVPEVLNTVENGRADATRAQIGSLKNILIQYKLATGAFPTTEQGLDALYNRPVLPPIPEKWNGPYSSDPIRVDAWGRPYNYRCPGEHNEKGYDLWSFGADGVEGGEGAEGAAADITNWIE